MNWVDVHKKLAFKFILHIHAQWPRALGFKVASFDSSAGKHACDMLHRTAAPPVELPNLHAIMPKARA